MKFKLIIFVGPQGTGKTTQATLLRYWLRLHNIKADIRALIHYTLLHKSLLRIIVFMAKIFNRYSLTKFYPDEPPGYAPTPELMKVIFPILVYFHVISMFIDFLVFKLKQEVLIEHEGFLFKQIADLYYLGREFRLLNSKSFSLFLKLALRLLQSLDSTIVISLQVNDYRTLVDRYAKQRLSGALWRKTEPWDYILLQQAVYRVLAGNNACFINAQQTPLCIFEKILECIDRSLSDKRPINACKVP